MNALVTRRALLGATVAVGSVALPAIAEAAFSTVPHTEADADLLGLIARHAAVVAERNVHQDPLEEAEARFKAAEPLRPATLTETFGDVISLGGSTGRDTYPNGRPWCYFTSGDVARLRAQGAVTSPAWDEDGRPLPPVLNLRGESRRQKILAAHDAWEAEKLALADRVGLTAATAEDDRLYELTWWLRETIRDTTPATLAGLGVKARWAMGLDDAEEENGAVVRDLAGFGAAS